MFLGCSKQATTELVCLSCNFDTVAECGRWQSTKLLYLVDRPTDGAVTWSFSQQHTKACWWSLSVTVPNRELSHHCCLLIHHFPRSDVFLLHTVFSSNKLYQSFFPSTNEWMCIGGLEVKIHIYIHTYMHIKSRAIPLEGWTGPEGSRRLRLPDLKRVGIWRW